MQDTGVAYVLLLYLGGQKLKTIGAVPEDRALASASVYQDVSRLIGAVFPDDQPARVNTGSFQAVSLDLSSQVVADSTDVFRPQAQLGAANYGSSDLSSGAEHFVLERYFPRIGRKLVEQDEGVGRVEPNA